MDAVKFLKEYNRMCNSYGHDCSECGIDKMRNGDGCTSIIHAHPEEAVSVVEKWSAEHTAKMRQNKPNWREDMLRKFDRRSRQ